VPCVFCKKIKKQGQNSDVHTVMWGCMLVSVLWSAIQNCISEDSDITME
jgi:hypothetical protein